jgi:hypothetical protein
VARLSRTPALDPAIFICPRRKFVTGDTPLVAVVRAHVAEAVPSSAIAVPKGAHVALT